MNSQIIWSPSQQMALQALSGDENLFISGAAGSGKSFVIRHFLRQRSPKTFPVLASTGAAAVLIGGRTFHSFMGLGILEGGVDKTLNRALGDRRLRKRLQKIEGFVLDEISMISADTFRCAESICRHIRGKMDIPWGGLRIVVVGDFAQLPPVGNSSDGAKWAFQEEIWNWSQLKSIWLSDNMRANDEDFIKILGYLRRGECNQEVSRFLDERLLGEDEVFEGTRLFPRRHQTESFNLTELQKIDYPLVELPSEFEGTEMGIKQLRRVSPLPEVLRIKKDCLVMIRQNDPQQRWVNGTTGWVREIGKQELGIELQNGRYISLERVSFSLLSAEGDPVATVMNFPLSLAYATTIHKAQGMTIDRLLVDLRKLWEPGHAYVAVSRVTHPDGLRVQGWDRRSILTDPSVSSFYENSMS